MQSRTFTIDWSHQYIISTSTTDASVTIPVDTPAADAVGQSRSMGGSWYLMGVSGSTAYINQNAAATSSNVLHPLGRDEQPKRIPPGTVMHALASSGTGQVWFVRCFVVD